MAGPEAEEATSQLLTASSHPLKEEFGTILHLVGQHVTYCPCFLELGVARLSITLPHSLTP